MICLLPPHDDLGIYSLTLYSVPAMLEIFKKLFVKHFYPAALTLSTYPLWRSYFVFVFFLWFWSRDSKFVALVSIPVAVFPVSCSMVSDHEHHKKIMAEMFTNVGLQFDELSAYIDDQRDSCQAGDEEPDAFQLCSSTITRQCLVSKQRAEAMYSAARVFNARGYPGPSWSNFAQIVLGLGGETQKIQAIVKSYSAFRVTLTGTPPESQLEAAQQWEAKINAAYLPIAAEPFDEV
ncbi:hypothetical protein ARMSODRAFT_1006445 [Armillaria solidipes]|uniref:Uncharacterized protein n=1 Tax=Armillaria solidipes TaxID=1076256 RepID=A0A2H3B7A0_9AGAR|nr:hypothetical protein ARMSODRAFT_1006445 [Armillaria solidipes]